MASLPLEVQNEPAEIQQSFALLCVLPRESHWIRGRVVASWWTFYGMPQQRTQPNSPFWCAVPRIPRAMRARVCACVRARPCVCACALACV